MGSFTDRVTVGYALVEADLRHLLTKSVWAEEHGALAKKAEANAVRGAHTSVHREIGA